MRKIILLIFGLFFLSLTQKSYAQELIIPTDSLSPAATATPTSIEYELPYPGVLPGSPFYVLKSIRDKFTEVLMPDPLRRSNFYLLQADKRLSIALILYEDERKEEGEVFLSKSLNYLDMSLGKAQDASNNGENIMDILAKIKTSSAKQKEEIKILIKENSGENREKLENAYDRAEDIEKRANQIKL